MLNNKSINYAKLTKTVYIVIMDILKIIIKYALPTHQSV
jgi:hypothetical protein